MVYNILGVNLSHNGSVCVVDNKGNILFYLEEERITRVKYDDVPYTLLKKISQEYKINEIVVSGLAPKAKIIQKSLNFIFKELFPNIPILSLLNQHHLTHASLAYHKSPFNSALSIVLDAAGSQVYLNPSNYYEVLRENETIYKFEDNTPPVTLYKTYMSLGDYVSQNPLEYVTPSPGIAYVYEIISKYIGFKWNECGKTMGLSSYKPNPSNNFTPFFKDFRGNPEVFIQTGFPDNYSINSNILPKNITDIDLAYKVQKESQEVVGNLIEKYINLTQIKNICCSGGYFLNCVANYYLKKRFPDVNFYVDPIAHDGGTSIGGVLYKLYNNFNLEEHIKHKSHTSLYYGPQYSKEQLSNGIQKYVDI